MNVMEIIQIESLEYLKENNYPEDKECVMDKDEFLDTFEDGSVIGGGYTYLSFLQDEIFEKEERRILNKLHELGCEVHSVVGFRNKDIVILEDEFKAVSDEMRMMTDDGSHGEKGLVTDALKALIEAGNQYDEVIVIGPVIMMKFVCLLTKEYGIKTVVSMNPVMIDGTGMCGGCRVTVGGKTKFACVDGPDFDGHLVDFDELMRRNSFYREQEDHICRMGEYYNG